MAFRLKCIDGSILKVGNIKYSSIISSPIFEVSEFDSFGASITDNIESVMTEYGTTYRGLNPSLLGYKKVYKITNLSEMRVEIIQYSSSSPIRLLCSFYYNNKVVKEMLVSIKPGSSSLANTLATYSDGRVPLVNLYAMKGEKIGNITDIGIGYTEANTVGSGQVTSVIISGTGQLYNSSYGRQFIADINGNGQIVAEPDSEPVDDDYGNFDNNSIAVQLPSLSDVNAVSALSTNLVKAYKLTNTALSDFASFLWSTNYHDTVIKNQNSPIENIQKVHCLPFNVAAGDSAPVVVGNVVSEVNGLLITQQFQEIDFGTVNLAEYYGTSLDYYTEVSIFLPFIGECKLDVQDVMQGAIKLVYRVDVLTGNCVALISVKRNRNGTNLDSVLYQFNGNMSNEFPLTQYTNQSLTNRANVLQNIASNPLGSIGEAIKGISNEVKMMNYGDAWNTSRAGNMAASLGYMGVLTPYFILKMPINIKPKDYAKYFGLPSYYTRKLSELSGYTEVSEIDLTGIDLTSTEKARLENILKSGFYI